MARQPGRLRHRARRYREQRGSLRTHHRRRMDSRQHQPRRLATQLHPQPLRRHQPPPRRLLADHHPLSLRQLHRLATLPVAAQPPDPPARHSPHRLTLHARHGAIRCSTPAILHPLRHRPHRDGSPLRSRQDGHTDADNQEYRHVGQRRQDRLPRGHVQRPRPAHRPGAQHPPHPQYAAMDRHGTRPRHHP